MTKEETLNAIREVLLWVHSGKQDISNGLEEIELINDTYNKKLTKELKRVTKKASIMEGDNFTLTRAFDLLNKNYGKMVDEIEEQRKIIEELRNMIKN